MPLPSGRFSQLRWLQNFVAVGGVLGALTLIGLGMLGQNTPDGSANVWMIVAGVFLFLLTVMMMTLSRLMLKMESTMARQLGELRDLNEIVAKQVALLSSIVENTRISDSAKALAHRGQELDALRTAIREDFRNERWEAGLNLIDEMEQRFGYKEEADRIREELDEARNTAIEGRLQEAIELVEGHFKVHEWSRAQGEIDRLLHALPDHTRVLALLDRMTVLKAQHKHELKLGWAEAVRRNDTDHAIDVLKELDQYLSATEAEELQASARDVFKEKLLQVGVQFRFAVTEKRWSDALGIGLELIRDYPNARMAGEVREALDTLREKARAVADSSNAATLPTAYPH